MKQTSLFFGIAIAALAITACNSDSTVAPPQSVDLLLKNGLLYNGELTEPVTADVAICGANICGVFTEPASVVAKQEIELNGKVISPGFIDPHTHTLDELASQDKNHNLNYLTQGVTTVVNGNDGDSPIDIKSTANQLNKNGIGTNVAFYIGHNSIRRAVMGTENRYSTPTELEQMKGLVEQAMQDGAIGLSSGLYYVPGNYANTDEVIALAAVTKPYQGVYDTHLRDESTFNIGFDAAIDEAIDVAKNAGVHLHIAHIKALGVDVWGQSQNAIDKITKAINSGVSISADQYPWLASGTKLRSAVMPKWVMADSRSAFHQRLNDPALKTRLTNEIRENIRRRGGANALLITEFDDEYLIGLTLKEIAKKYKKTPVETAIALVQQGEVRVASFNMSPTDVERFMTQPWVVTSSDGTNGHPRKYASFPKKYTEYVNNKKLLTLGEFIHRSSGKTAKILGLSDRGFIKTGLRADIIVFDPNNIKVNADFSHWNKLSLGMDYVLVNGKMAINQGKFTETLAGEFVKKLAKQ